MTTHSNDGHRKRLRTRFLSGGTDAFAKHELIEMFLQIAIPRRDTKPMAKLILEKFGNVGNSLHADKKSLTEVKGIGGRTANLFELYCETEKICKNFEYPSYKTGFEHYAAKMTENDKGTEFYFAVADGCERVLYCRRIFDGNSLLVEEYLTEIVTAVMRCGGRTVFIFQNRPSYETLNIYDDDIRAARVLKEYLSGFDIEFGDFVVICKNRFCSYNAYIQKT